MGVLGWLAHGLKHDVKNVLIKLALLLHSFLNVLLLLLAFAHFDCNHVPDSRLFVVHKHLGENPGVQVEALNLRCKLGSVVGQDGQEDPVIVAHLQELLLVALENMLNNCPLHMLYQGLD